MPISGTQLLLAIEFFFFAARSTASLGKPGDDRSGRPRMTCRIHILAERSVLRGFLPHCFQNCFRHTLTTTHSHSPSFVCPHWTVLSLKMRYSVYSAAFGLLSLFTAAASGAVLQTRADAVCASSEQSCVAEGASFCCPQALVSK